MKKIIILLVFVFSITTTYSQFSVKGTMTPAEKGDVVLLYKIQGAKQKYVTHAKLVADTVEIAGNKQTLAKFEFNIAKDSIGSYRAVYRDRGAGFVDFVFNNENIEMVFNPEYPDQSVTFLSSNENKVYREYLDALTLTQRKVDSIQISYVDNKSNDSKKEYKEALKELNSTQKIYEKKSKGMIVNSFIKSSKTSNPDKPFDNVKDYLNSVVGNFFNNVSFEDTNLINSPFLIDKINYFVLYLNTSESQALQQKLYKESIEKVMLKATNAKQKKQFSEYLIDVFTSKRNSGVVDWVFEKYYDKLPANLINKQFKKNKLDLLKASVGRIAPDFSWKEGGKSYKLSTIDDGEKYLLIFWSTRCSHCTAEIPEVYEYMKKHKDVSVITFAIEEDDLDFNNWAKNKLYNWHNAIGTHPENRFENQTVQDYLIDATPTYFILDKTKKIINVPDGLKDVKEYLENNK